jgi:xylulokinase
MTDSRPQEGYALGVDVGTSACKTVLVDERGRIVTTAARGYPTHRTTWGEVTQDPRDWLRAVATTVRACVDLVGGRNVTSISVTAPAHVAVLVDRDGSPLARPLLAFDARPDRIAQALRCDLGPAFFERTFVELTAGWTLPQLVWLRDQLGQAEWRRVAHVMLQKDYVRLCMTGAVATDPTDAAGTAMIDQRRGEWQADLCNEAGLSIDQLPEIRPSFALGGVLCRSWARRIGLRAGTPVAIGATDTAVELLSVDAAQPGDSIAKIASTGTIVTVTTEPRPRRGLLTYPHALAGRWYSASATSTAAVAYNWLGGILDLERDPRSVTRPRYERLAMRLPPGSEGLLFLPFLQGERVPYWDSRLRGAFLGLSSAHGRAHLARAAMEGIALSLRDCLELMRSAGLEIVDPVLTGGGTTSLLWRRILVSALGTGGHLASPQGPAFGAALLAQATVSGETRSARPRRTPVAAPDGWVASYDRIYRIYVEAAAAVTTISHELADIAASSRAGGAAREARASNARS